MLKITRNQLEKEYLVDKLTDYEISKKYNCSAPWIGILRKKWMIKSIKKYERNDKQKLLPQQEELVYGSLLGDASFGGRRNTNCNVYFRVSHISKSLIEFKHNIMKSFIKTKVKPWKDKRLNRKEMYDLRTISHPVFTNIYKVTHLNNIKTISQEWLDKITPFGLAIWYMDDGSITKSNYMMRISSESFDLDGHLLIQRYFREKWNISVKINPSSAKNHYLLCFKAKERNKFFTIIRPYIIPAMKYKIQLGNGKWSEWTKSEIEYLKQTYLPWENDWEELCEKLERSRMAIERKVCYLKLTGEESL